MLKSKQMLRVMIMFLIGFILMQLVGCNIRKPTENISDSTDLDSSLPTTPSGKTETFIYAGLKLEVTNVQDIRDESMVDDGGNPWEYKIFICYPGARATILDAGMSDANFSADGKPHGNWGIELVSDERIRIVDDTDSFEVTPDIVGIYNLESSLYVIKFEIMENEKVIIQDKFEGIVVESPMTISNNELSNINGQIRYLRLKMKEGRYYEDWNPGAYMGTIWEGKYSLELVDEVGEVMDYIELNKIFKASTLIFTSSFKIEFDDYNDDGNIDFTIGQFVSSGMREYKLFTINKDEKIEILPIRDNSSLYIGYTTGYYSTKLTKSYNKRFKIEYYNNTEGKNIEEVYEWDGEAFKRIEINIS